MSEERRRVEGRRSVAEGDFELTSSRRRAEFKGRVKSSQSRR